ARRLPGPRGLPPGRDRRGALPRLPPRPRRRHDAGRQGRPMTAQTTAKPIVTIALAHETDIVLVRQRARQIAALLGFDTHDQTRITTAVSEIARNVLEHGRGGRAEFRATLDDGHQGLEIVLSDQGPGIADLGAVLAGDYQSPTGM